MPRGASSALRASVICFGTARGGVDLRAAVQLAEDVAASPQERQNAYARANKELDGLIVLPAPVRASIERRIAAAIEA